MKVRLWLLLSIFAAGISSLYMHRILGPWSSHNRLENGFVIAQLNDLYPPWLGTRELLLRRRNPYGPEVSHEIQMFFYGHAINQTYAKPGVPLVNEQRFAYPIYEVFITAPFVYADFADVQRWAPFALGSLLALNILFCFRLLHGHVRGEAVAATVLFVLSSPQIVQALRLQQLATVEACFLIAGAWCVSRNHLATAGVLLAFSTVKPQMGLLPLCWFAVWAAGDWRRRWRLPASFLATLAALFAAGELLLPGWLGFFLAGLAAYRRYALPTSLLRIALGDTAGQILGGLIVVAILVFAWRNRHVEGGSPQFVFILAAFFMATVLTFPLFTPFNQVLLILPAMLLIQDWKSLRRFSRLVFIVSVSWPWIVSLVLLLFRFRPRLDFPNQLPLLPSFLVSFFPLLLPLLLMTRRSEIAMPPRPATVLRAS
jgi:Glycosyltransferase family 87